MSKWESLWHPINTKLSDHKIEVQTSAHRESRKIMRGLRTKVDASLDLIYYRVGF